MNKRSYNIVESDGDLGTLKGRYTVFIILPVVIGALFGIVMSISILGSELETGFKVFLFIASLLLTGLLCWLLICGIAIIRMFMYHVERINYTTDAIYYELRHEDSSDDKAKTKIESVPMSKDKKICPTCGNTNLKTAATCIYCGQEFPEEKPSEYTECKACGAKVKSTDEVCFNCGKSLKE